MTLCNLILLVVRRVLKVILKEELFLEHLVMLLVLGMQLLKVLLVAMLLVLLVEGELELWIVYHIRSGHVSGKRGALMNYKAFSTGLFRRPQIVPRVRSGCNTVLYSVTVNALPQHLHKLLARRGGSRFLLRG